MQWAICHNPEAIYEPAYRSLNYCSGDKRARYSKWNFHRRKLVLERGQL